MKYKVPFIKPFFPSSAQISEDYEKIVASNWFTNFGPYEQEFRQKAAEFIGQGVFASTAANATLAIELACRALLTRTESRGHVLVPSFTFASGPEVLISEGYTPVFIDIDPESWQPDIVQAEAYITAHEDKLSGILLCNTFGVGNEKVAKWEELAKKYALPLIIDSAAGFGSRYNVDSYVGARGDCEIFSLHATKPFAVGEGGLFVSRNEAVIDKVRSLQNFGFDASRDIVGIGTNAKLQELNCALGLRQLEGFEARLEDRQESLEYYKQRLQPLGYGFQENDTLSTVAFVSTVAPTPELAKAASTRLVEYGVEVKRYYSPLHMHSIFDTPAIRADSLKNTEEVYSRILSLPLHDRMSHETIDMIADIIHET